MQDKFDPTPEEVRAFCLDTGVGESQATRKIRAENILRDLTVRLSDHRHKEICEVLIAMHADIYKDA